MYNLSAVSRWLNKRSVVEQSKKPDFLRVLNKAQDDDGSKLSNHCEILEKIAQGESLRDIFRMICRQLELDLGGSAYIHIPISDASPTGIKVWPINFLQNHIIRERLAHGATLSSNEIYETGMVYSDAPDYITPVLCGNGELQAVVVWRGMDNHIPNRVGMLLERSRYLIKVALERERFLNELMAAKAKVEQANETKSHFLSQINHDLRTPLNAIIGMAHLTLKKELQPAHRDSLEKIHNAGSTLLGIVNDVLDLSKIEAGKLAVELVGFDLKDVLDNILDIVGYKARDKGLELVCKLAPSFPSRIMGDPLRLEQVLSNLLSNAIKFTAAGEVELAVEAIQKTHEKLQIRFTVRDTGIGMTSEQVFHLFQPFVQGDPSTTRKYGGTGLGLSITKKLVELMGGQIWVQSLPGKGSVFSFTLWFGYAGNQLSKEILPKKLHGQRVLVVDDNASARDALVNTLCEEAKQESPQEDSYDTANGYGLSGIRVLLVEDYKINQEIAVELLKLVGVQVDIVNTGREAVEKLQSFSENPYHAVLMDLQMPEMDGYEATRVIRKNQQLQELPILAMTAHAMPEVRERCLTVGMNDHVAKPIDPETLYQALAKWTRPNSDKLHKPKEVIRDCQLASIAVPIPVLPKVHTSEGVRRVGGDPQVYLAMLKKFRVNQRQSMEEIRDFLSKGDKDSAIRSAHSLKGILGTLGAKELQEKTRIIEASMHHDAAGLEALLNDLDFDLVLLFAAIDSLLIEENKAATKAADNVRPIDFAELDALVKGARRQLEEFDAGVENTIAKLHDVLREHHRLVQGLEMVEKCLQGYDYEQGLVEFDRWGNVYLKLYLDKNHELQEINILMEND